MRIEADCSNAAMQQNKGVHNEPPNSVYTEEEQKQNQEDMAFVNSAFGDHHPDELAAFCLGTEFEAKDLLSNPPQTSALSYNSKPFHQPAQCDVKKCKTALHDIIGSMGTVDIVSAITLGWKKRADNLAFTPVEAVEYYKIQYKNLTSVLSISLFNKILTDVHEDAEDNVYVADKRQNGSATKRKLNNTSTTADYEYIVIEKNGNYMFRRVESAMKYAQKTKPATKQYICVMPKKNENGDTAKTFVEKLRRDDGTFLSGNSINFKGTIQELYKELCDRLDRLKLEDSVLLKHVDETEIEERDEAVKQPPAKKAKLVKSIVVKPPKQPVGRKIMSNVLDMNVRSHVEADTDSESYTDSDVEDYDHQAEQVKTKTITTDILMDDKPVHVNRNMTDLPVTPSMNNNGENIVKVENKKKKGNNKTSLAY